MGNRLKKYQILNGAQLKYIAFFSMLLVGIFSILAMFLSLDYDFHAVIVAYLFYIFYPKPLWGAGLGFQLLGVKMDIRPLFFGTVLNFS